MRWLACLVLLVSCGPPPATLVLREGAVYTMDPNHPWAAAVVITDNKITAVLDNVHEASQYIGPQTRVVDLDGRFMLPGFIDGHIHFNRAGALINDVNLLAVSDDEGLRAELERIAALLAPGESSCVLNAYCLPEGKTYPEIHSGLKQRGFVVYAGQGSLVAEMFRISTMGDISHYDMERLLAALSAVFSA